MAVVIPDWLKPPDIAGEYSRGLQLGVSIQDAQNKLAAENDRAQMEAQMRSQSRADEHEKEQAQIAATAAYRTTQTGLEQQRLDELKSVNDERTRQAALKAAASISYAKDLQATDENGDPLYSGVQALARNPLVMTPAAVDGARKFDMDLGTQRLNQRAALAKTQQDQRQQALDHSKQVLQERETFRQNHQVTLKEGDALGGMEVKADQGSPMAKAALAGMDSKVWKTLSPRASDSMAIDEPPTPGYVAPWDQPGGAVPIPPPAAVQPDGGSDQSPVTGDQSVVPVPPPLGASTRAVPVQTQADYDALAPGTLYINPQGVTKRKKAS